MSEEKTAEPTEAPKGIPMMFTKMELSVISMYVEAMIPNAGQIIFEAAKDGGDEEVELAELGQDVFMVVLGDMREKLRAVGIGPQETPEEIEARMKAESTEATD